MATTVETNAELDRIVEQADDFVHTGPGTLAGRYLRRYWQPIYVSEKLAQGSIVPIRILGEDLALYRGESGTPRVMTNECPHRLTRLSTGWIEGETIRCRYHGWRYDESGRCVEQPAEPKPFCARVPKLASYPTHEAHGLVFAYLGEGDAPPFRALPGLEDGAREGWTVCPSVEMIPCNYFQSAENIMDDVHVNFSHRDHLVNTTARPYVPTKMWARETPFGLTHFLERGERTDRLHFIMPNQCFVAHPLRSARDNEPFWFKALFWYVPIDDESCYWYAIFTSYSTPVDKDKMRAQRLELFEPPSYRSKRNRSNNYGFDPHEQATSTYTGMGLDINVHDQWAVESMGPIQDRTREHLGTSDKVIMANRRMLIKAIEQVQAGAQPPMALSAAEAAQLTGPDTMDCIAPADRWDAFWREAAARKRAGASWLGADASLRSPSEAHS